VGTLVAHLRQRFEICARSSAPHATRFRPPPAWQSSEGHTSTSRPSPLALLHSDGCSYTLLIGLPHQPQPSPPTPTQTVGVSAQTQDTKNEFEMIFLFFCATQTPLPHPSRHTKDTKDLDWEPVWEPDGEPADVPDPRLRMGPSSSSPSGALRTTVGHLLHPNSGCWQPDAKCRVH
jgi:hypothetical protein